MLEGLRAVVRGDAQVPAGVAGDLRGALAAQDVIDGVAEQGLKAMSSRPEQLGRLVADDMAKWAPIVRKIGFSADS